MTHEFGGEWTDLKLDVMSAYFGAYAKALKNQPFSCWYVDAFAGTGERISSRTPEGRFADSLFGELEAAFANAKDGSVRRALNIDPPFQRYLFIDRSHEHVAKLNELRAEFTERTIEIVEGDANSALLRLCKETDWMKTRAAVFVDPYGMQVSWSTLGELAKTKAVDIALLFPTGPLNRLLKRDGSIPEQWARRIDDHLGPCNWREEMYLQSVDADLFDTVTSTRKAVEIPGLQSFVAARLRTIFPYVHSEAVPLMNSKGSILYNLFIICANSADKAIKLSRKLASGAIRAAKRSTK